MLKKNLNLVKEISIKRRIILPVIIAFAIGGLGLICLTYFILQNKLTNYFNNELNTRTVAFKEAHLNDVATVKAHLQLFENTDETVHLLQNGTPDQLKDYVNRLRNSLELTNVAILTYKTGAVVATTNSERFPASVLKQNKTVQSALYGDTKASTVYIDGTIGILAAGPVSDGETPLGVIVLFKSISTSMFADRYKELLGCELTVFFDNLRLSTSLLSTSGGRITGTTMDNQFILDTVYNKREMYFGKNIVNGEEYLTSYVPLELDNLDQNAMFFLGMPMEFIKKTQSSIATSIIPLIALLCIVLVVIVLLLMELYVIKPLKQAGLAIHNLNSDSGDADLTFRINIDRNDEIGRLCKDINKFLNKQCSLITELKKSQIALDGIVDNLGLSSQQSASAISEIMANIQGVRTQTKNQSNSVIKVNNLMSQNIQGVQHLDSLIENQSSGIVESSASIEEMVGNIESVSLSVEKMSEQFKQLITITTEGQNCQLEVDTRVNQMVEQSKLLMEANTVIAQISSQTNLLAMNAAIEAAHAGDAGAGFSVVADEIRKLAENSSKQSKNIKQELRGISQAINAVVQASKTSKEAFTKVTGQVSDTDNLVTEIHGAMTEQKLASQQVLEALKDINTSTTEVQTTAKDMRSDTEKANDEMQSLTQISETLFGSMDEMSAGATQINTSAQEVSSMAYETKEHINLLETLVGKFKTE